MSEKVKIVLGVIIGIVCAIAVFCLAVIIGCSVNGVTFGQQVCNWFGGAEETAANIVSFVGHNPIM